MTFSFIIVLTSKSYFSNILSIMNNQYNNPARALINIENFQHNIKTVRSLFPDSKIILPVKANAYGHGDVVISHAAANCGIDYLAVARVNEGIRLRNAGVTLPVLIFGIEWGSNIDLGYAYDLEFTVCSPEELDQVYQASRRVGAPIPVHLKVDTGITRLGCKPEEVLDMAAKLHNSREFIFKSFYTHFARSDDDIELTLGQYNRFLELARNIDSRSIEPLMFHAHNSGAILHPSLRLETGLLTAVRPGLMSYGYSPTEEFGRDLLKPVMTLVSRVMHVKDVRAGTGIGYGHTFITTSKTRLAAIPLGYGDGIFRSLSGRLEVTINGKLYPCRGRISMDIIVIEIDRTVKPGDQVYIFGPPGECHNTADDLAALAGTISYEITTSLNCRIDRIPVNPARC